MDQEGCVQFTIIFSEKCAQKLSIRPPGTYLKKVKRLNFALILTFSSQGFEVILQP